MRIKFAHKGCTFANGKRKESNKKQFVSLDFLKREMKSTTLSKNKADAKETFETIVIPVLN